MKIKLRYIIMVMFLLFSFSQDSYCEKENKDETVSFWNMSIGASIAVSTGFIGLIGAVIGVFKIMQPEKKKEPEPTPIPIPQHTPETCTVAIPLKKDIEVMNVKIDTLLARVDKIDNDTNSDVNKIWDTIEKLRDHILKFFQGTK